MIGLLLWIMALKPNRLIKIVDKNNEIICGARIEILNTHQTYYSNINGECLIPNNGEIKVESISYKTEITEIKDQITLESR